MPRWIRCVMAMPLVAAFILTTMPGCPPRETRIEISAAGAGVLLNACNEIDVAALCEGIEVACAGRDDLQPCVEATDECMRLTTQGQCSLDALRPPNISETRAVGIVLALVASDDSVQQASACTTAAFGCNNQGDTPTTDCIAQALNDALARVMPDGLGFDGLEDPSEVTPVLLVFADLNGDGEYTCEPEALFACGALGERVPSAESYDILCGACEGGPRLPVDAAPCGDCYLPKCLDYAGQL